MPNLCTHTLRSGSTCQSPAVRGTSLCFHHTPHENIKRERPRESEPFKLPPINSKNNILAAIGEVLRALAERRITRSEAATFVSGLKFAERLMTELDQTAAAPLESEPASESMQQTLDEIAAGLGVEMPSLEEMLKLQASMPNCTPEQALNYWISSGRIRPRQSADGAGPEGEKQQHRRAHDCSHALSRPHLSAA